MERWRLSAACRPDDDRPSLTRLFFPDPRVDPRGSLGKRVYRDCPVVIDCLDYAVRANEPDGVWGSLAPEQRVPLRAALAAGDPLAYRAALVEAVSASGRQRLTERPCGRCGATIPVGVHPPDRNPPGAQCGRVATYNRGCRCLRCIEAKSRSRSPRGETERYAEQSNPTIK